MMSPARKTTKPTKTTPPPSADALPHLSAFLSGYLHEDFRLDYDTPAAAMADFLSECNSAERRRLTKDWRTFTAAVEGRPWREVRTAFSVLGGAWRPPSRAALDALFSALD
jgi:hypothetical protein